MTREIRCKNDLELAYTMLKILEDSRKRQPDALIDEHIKEYKQAIRAYYKKEEKKDRWYIQADDFGYATQMILLPEYLESEEDADEYFRENEYMECIPSQYDCTGQHFTCGYKIIRRHGRFIAYHSIGTDI